MLIFLVRPGCLRCSVVDVCCSKAATASLTERRTGGGAASKGKSGLGESRSIETGVEGALGREYTEEVVCVVEEGIEREGEAVPALESGRPPDGRAEGREKACPSLEVSGLSAMRS